MPFEKKSEPIIVIIVSGSVNYRWDQMDEYRRNRCESQGGEVDVG